MDNHSYLETILNDVLQKMHKMDDAFAKIYDHITENRLEIEKLKNTTFVRKDIITLIEEKMDSYSLTKKAIEEIITAKLNEIEIKRPSKNREKILWIVSILSFLLSSLLIIKQLIEFF